MVQAGAPSPPAPSRERERVLRRDSRATGSLISAWRPSRLSPAANGVSKRMLAAKEVGTARSTEFLRVSSSSPWPSEFFVRCGLQRNFALPGFGETSIGNMAEAADWLRIGRPDLARVHGRSREGKLAFPRWTLTRWLTAPESRSTAFRNRRSRGASTTPSVSMAGRRANLRPHAQG